MSATLVLQLALLLGVGQALAATGSVCIDPGHGGSDPGAMGSGLVEKDLNLSAALHFRDWLALDTTDGGGGGTWDVVMTRDDDTYVSLSARCDYANSRDVDWFMSIHANAGGGNGTETYAYASGGTSDLLAHSVQEEVVAHLGTYSRGVKYASFTVLTGTSMPADLNEMAFIDVWANNAELLADDANLDLVALAHLHAIQAREGLTSYTPSSSEPVDPDPTATVSFQDLPLEVDEARPFGVQVNYGTNLYELGQRGQIGLRVQDASSWAVLDEQLWDNGGIGLQGPAGSWTFETSVRDAESVFFVTWLSPLGGSFDDRYDEASSASTPTTVRPEEGPGDTEGGGDDTGPKPPSETDVEIVRYPGHVVASAPTELRVQWTWDEPGPGILFVQRVDADTGGLVDLLVSDVGMDGRPFVQDFVFPARGARSVFFVACLGALEEISTGTCVARDSTEARPTSVVVPIASSRGGLCAVSERAPGVALVLVSSCLLAGLARRRRSGSSQLGRPVDGPRRAS